MIVRRYFVDMLGFRYYLRVCETNDRRVIEREVLGVEKCETKGPPKWHNDVVGNDIEERKGFRPYDHQQLVRAIDRIRGL